MSVLPVGMGSSGVDVGDIGHSLRLRASASAYLSRTFGSISGNDNVTVSCWGKRTRQNSRDFILEADTSNRTYLAFESAAGASGDGLAFYVGGAAKINTTALFRDPSAWYHICLIFDGAAAGGTATIYVNNVSVGSATGIGTTIKFCQNVAHAIGRDSAGGVYADEYLSRFCVVSGSALTPSSFGYQNTEINEWVSKSQSQVLAVVEAGGTNSFMLDFDDATSLTTLGYDKSTKNNDWTLNNVSLTAGVTYDWMLDVPGNSYATLNPLDNKLNTTLSAANLTWSPASANQDIAATVPFPSEGVFWCEFTITTLNTNCGVGLVKLSGYSNRTTYYLAESSPIGCLYLPNSGQSWMDNSYASYGATYTSGDVIGMLVNVSAGEIKFYKQTGGTGNFSAQPTLTYSTSGVPYVAYIYAYGGTYHLNMGQRPFNYATQHGALPSSALALCQANLPASGTVTVSGSFTGNASADGPFVWMNGVPLTLTINGNAVTFGTHADKTAGGFKLRTASASYNTAGSNTWTATITSDVKNLFKYRNAQGNP